MAVVQSPAHNINSSKGFPSITESFPLWFFLVVCATVAALPVVEPHWPRRSRHSSYTQSSLGVTGQVTWTTTNIVNALS
jgi:hypothetical protein